MGKIEPLRGLTEPGCIEPAIEMMTADQKKYANPKPEPGQQIKPDKSGWRTGITPPEDVCKRMFEEAQKAKDAIHVRNVDMKKALSIQELAQVVETLRGMVMIAYPAYHGLYEWDSVYEILEDLTDFPNQYPDVEWHDPKSTTIWACRKEWIPGKLVRDYIPNEKTKMVVKLAKTGGGQPVAEPQIDKE